MAAQAGAGQGQPLIRTENVCGARPSHHGKNGTGRVQWPCRCRTVLCIAESVAFCVSFAFAIVYRNSGKPETAKHHNIKRR